MNTFQSMQQTIAGRFASAARMVAMHAGTCPITGLDRANDGLFASSLSSTGDYRVANLGTATQPKWIEVKHDTVSTQHSIRRKPVAME